MSRFLLIRFVLPLLLLAGILTGVGVWMGVGVSLDSSARTLLQSDPRNRETFEKMTSLLPETTFVMVAVEMEDLFSNPGASLITRLSNAMLKVGGATEVKSLTHSGRPVRKGFSFDIEPFIPQRADPETWKVLREFTTSFPLSRNVMVSADGRYAVLVGLYERPLPDHAARNAFREEFLQAVEPFREEAESLHVLSFPFLEAEGTLAVQEDLSRYSVLAVLLVIGVLWLTFRSLPGMLMVLLLEFLGGLCLMGVFHVLGRPVDVYTGILFPLVGGLQLTFIIHYLAAFQSACRDQNPERAARAAFSEVFPPSAVACLTTLAGLATLAVSGVPTVQGFGRLGLIAVTVVFAVTFLLPAAAAGFRLRKSAASPPTSGLEQHRVHPWRFLLPAVGITAILLLGIPHIRTDIRAKEFIEPGHPIRETVELLDADLGGVNIFQLEVDTGKPGGLQTLPMLRYMEDLRAFAKTLEGVSDAYAYSQLYIALNQIWDGDVLSTGTLPVSGFKLNLFSNLLNTSPLLFKDSFVDAAATTSLVILRSRDMPGSAYLDLLETFMDYAEDQKPAGVTLRPVQGLHTILEGDRAIVQDQVKTLGWSALSIALILSLLWRSPRLSLCVLAANLPALATLFGVMGWIGFPLNSITVMVAAVILGIAVDDGIHLVSAYRHLCKNGFTAQDAAGRALRMKIRPMACTSSILAVFLGLLALTSFPPVAHFGILSALGLAAAFSGAVFVLPALLSFKGSSRSLSVNHFGRPDRKSKSKGG